MDFRSFLLNRLIINETIMLKRIETKSFWNKLVCYSHSFTQIQFDRID